MIWLYQVACSYRTSPGLFSGGVKMSIVSEPSASAESLSISSIMAATSS